MVPVCIRNTEPPVTIGVHRLFYARDRSLDHGLMEFNPFHHPHGLSTSLSAHRSDSLSGDIFRLKLSRCGIRVYMTRKELLHTVLLLRVITPKSLFLIYYVVSTL